MIVNCGAAAEKVCATAVATPSTTTPNKGDATPVGATATTMAPVGATPTTLRTTKIINVATLRPPSDYASPEPNILELHIWLTPATANLSPTVLPVCTEKDNAATTSDLGCGPVSDADGHGPGPTMLTVHIVKSACAYALLADALRSNFGITVVRLHNTTQNTPHNKPLPLFHCASSDASADQAQILLS
jgi:hypothetical protein